MKVSQITEIIENKVPKHLAYEWDNVGLLVGDKEKDVNSVFITLDTNLETVKEAYFVESIDTTDNFESDEDKAIAVGGIVKGNTDNNEVVFAINTDAEPEQLDESPATSDKAELYYHIINIIAIIGVVGIVVAYIYNRKKASDK